MTITCPECGRRADVYVGNLEYNGDVFDYVTLHPCRHRVKLDSIREFVEAQPPLPFEEMK